MMICEEGWIFSATKKCLYKNSQVGFYYKREETEIMCAFCTCRIAHFPPDANLVQRHLESCPECNFLRYPEQCGNIPIDPITGDDVAPDTEQGRRLNLLTRRLISDSEGGSKYFFTFQINLGYIFCNSIREISLNQATLPNARSGGLKPSREELRIVLKCMESAKPTSWSMFRRRLPSTACLRRG
jgi:hypothetical protein